MADEHLDWKPRAAAQQRLTADPLDWSAFSVGDQVGVFVGNCWRKGVVLSLHSHCIQVRAKRLSSTTASIFSVYDARNVCQAADLSRASKTDDPLAQQHALFTAARQEVNG